MASGDKRIGTFEDGMPFGTELMCIGPLLQATATDFKIYVPVGMGAIRVKKVRSFLTVAITVGNSVITVKKQHAAETEVNMTGGTLTITQSACAVADEDYCNITNDATARVPEGDKIILSHNGGPGAGEAVFFIEYERVQ